MRLAAIDIRLRRAVDQNIELRRAERFPEFRRVTEIELGVIEAKNLMRPTVGPDERRTQAASGADDGNSW